MSFSENLNYLRKREGISQEELAEKLGVSRQAVSKWETGDAYPETEKIIMLCDRYGVTMDALLRGDVREAKEEAAGIPESAPSESAQGGVNYGGETKERPRNAEQEEGFNLHIGPAEYETAAQGIAQGVLWMCAVLAYLVMGVLGDLWHPGWILFVFMPAVAAVVDLIAAPKAIKRGKIAQTIDSIAIFGAAGTYLLCGFFLGMWGTMWVVFLIIPVVCIITGVFTKDKE